eukprot:256021-Chlamydomonas_euryale.AAC.1
MGSGCMAEVRGMGNGCIGERGRGMGSGCMGEGNAGGVGRFVRQVCVWGRFGSPGCACFKAGHTLFKRMRPGPPTRLPT